MLHQVLLEKFYDKPGPVKLYVRRGKWLQSGNEFDAIPDHIGSLWRIRPTEGDTRLADPPNLLCVGIKAPETDLRYAGYGYHKGYPTLSTNRGHHWLDINVNTIPERRAPVLRPSRTTETMLAKLNARERPGISEAQFKKLFCRCECGLYTTRQAFKAHDCLNEVIDLTDDN
jgi:hypothetical protein